MTVGPASVTTSTDPDARGVVLTGVWISALRCIVQYVIAPGLGAAGFWLPWMSELVQIIACLITASGALRLHSRHDRRRHLYTAIAVFVWITTVLTLLRPLT